MDASSSIPRRSPRLIEQAKRQELEHSENKRKRQESEHNVYKKIRQTFLSESDKASLLEQRRIRERDKRSALTEEKVKRDLEQRRIRDKDNRSTLTKEDKERDLERRRNAYRERQKKIVGDQCRKLEGIVSDCERSNRHPLQMDQETGTSGGMKSDQVPVLKPTTQAFKPRRSPRFLQQSPQRCVDAEKERNCQGDAAVCLPRRSPGFVEQTQYQDDEYSAEASQKRKGKSVLTYKKRRRPNSCVPGQKEGGIGENNNHHSTNDSSSDGGEQELVDSAATMVIPSRSPIGLDCEGSQKRKEKSPAHYNQPREKRKSEAHKTKSSNLQMRTDDVLRYEIPVKEIFSRLKLNLRSNRDLEQDRIRRLAQIRRNRILRYKKSLLERRRSPRFSQAPLVDAPITYAPSGLGNLFNVPVAFASCTRQQRSNRLTMNPVTSERDDLIDVQVTYPSKPSTPSNSARQRTYYLSRTRQQRSDRRVNYNFLQRIRRRRIVEASTDGVTSNSELSNNARTSNGQRFREIMDKLKWGYCVQCKAKFPDMTPEGICTFCKKDKKNHPALLLFSKENNMVLGDVPDELSRLTDLEKILIARVHPVMSVYRVKGQQYKYGGNVINFAQDVNVIAKVLPCKPKDLSAILVVKRIGNLLTKEFIVRREYVRQALNWLKNNNKYYTNIEISEENIDALPEEGVPCDLPAVDGDIGQQESDGSSGGNCKGDGCDGPPELQDQNVSIDEYESVGTIGVTVHPDQERHIRRALENDQIDKTNVDFPFTDEMISEFRTEGYISMAFPALFPDGSADLRESRARKVPERQYFQYLMRYHDGRFARDSRFRYFALNSLTRWHALSLGSVYINKYPQDAELSIENIREMVSSRDIRLAGRVSYVAQQIRGCRAYWYSRLKELISMVNQLGPPSIFFTLSAADLQWPELYMLLDPENKLEALDPMRRRRERARLLNENPLVVSWFFQKRVDVFFKEFLKKEFPLVDHWYRFEWQNRGSGHVHGFLWFNDRPDASRIATDEEVRRKIIEYFDNIICTWNPDPDFRVNIQDHHPCARKISGGSNLEDDENDYASLVNWVMRHTKCGSYCLRKSKITKRDECRFRFPIELSDDSKLVEEPVDSNIYRFVGRRNDELLNSHNRAVLQTWRANIDWSAITTLEAVIRYIAKYAAKSEPASRDFIDLLREIIDDPLKPCRDSTYAIKRLLLKNVSERDVSAQEVCHLLMGWNLTHSSRKFVLLNLSESRLLSCQLRKNRSNDDEEQGITDPNFFSRYLSRPDNYEQMSLFEMAKTRYYARRKWCKHRVEAVVRILPEFSTKNIMPDTDHWESYCKQQVLLNSHYRSVEGAIRNFATWSDCYSELIRPTENLSVDLGMVEDELEEEVHPEDDPRDEWMVAAAMAPNSRVLEDTDLGMRDIDINYEWSQGLQEHPSIHEKKGFINTLRQNMQETPYVSGSGTSFIALSRQQQVAHDMVLESLRSKSTIRLIISGGAGTGKSTLINAIVHSTRELFSHDKSVRIMAPTGVAAFNIGGSTIHHELAITADKNLSYKKLEAERCRHMQVDFKDTKLIIIDEYSMIGRKMLANIDLRLRDIFSTSEPFGNVSIVLVGDMRQLPPVFDTPLYAEGGGELQMTGTLSYSMFTQCVRLEQVFRQSGVGESEYREALSRLSDGNSTLEDWKLFVSRSYTTLSVQEKDNFDNAVRLFPTKDDAANHNCQCLRKLKCPVARIPSKNNCATAKEANSDEAKGLEDVLLLSKQSRVMLRKNYSTQFGLVNGSTGTVKDIIYDKEDKSPTCMPIAVIVDFDKYIGPRVYGETNLIPIIPVTTRWISSSGVACERFQLPLMLCWGITVHKSQGLTLDQAVVNIGTKERLGMTFVALSRTRRLRDLAFYPMFDFERIKRIGDCYGIKKRRAEEERLQKLASATQESLR